MPEDLYETMRRTIDAVVAAYSSPEPFSPDQIWATRTDDCLHYIHPKEAAPEAFRTPAKQEHHRQTLQFLGPVLEKFELEIKDAVIDVQTKTAVVRLAVRYDLRSVGNEGPERGLTTEFMWLMEMDDTRKKIRRVEEFLDYSSFLSLVVQKATKYAESQ